LVKVALPHYVSGRSDPCSIWPRHHTGDV
jgi:hypothetical protein